MPSSSDQDVAHGCRRPGCWNCSRVASDLDLNSVPLGMQSLYGNAGHQVDGEWPSWLWAPPELANYLEARGQLFLLTRGTIKDVQEAGAESIADILPVRYHGGNRRCSAQSPKEQVVLDICHISSQSVKGDGTQH